MNHLRLIVLFSLLFPLLGVAQDWSSRNLTDNGTSKNFINFNYRNCGGLLFFAGGSSTSTYNNEAWVSNGTFAGTFPIASRNAGLPVAYSPTEFTKVGNTVFFAASDSTNGRELWKCDLTTLATTLVKNIRLTAASSSPHSLAECNGKLLFICDADNSTVNGDELWISDGTAAGTVLLKDIIPGTGDSGVNGAITTMDGIAYFDANSYSGGGSALWRSDGTAAGTYLLVDAGVTSAFPGAFTSYQGSTYFFMTNSGSSGNYSLWKSTGTSAVLIKNSVADRCPDIVVIANNQMFFRGYDSESGEEVWKSDGTDVGTVRVTQVGPGSAYGLDGYYGAPSEIVAMGNNVYFVGTDGSTGKQLWRTDGTEAGTEMVELISNTAGASAPNPNGLLVFNNTLFFRMTRDGYGLEWFTSDGSSISSEPAVELWPGTNSVYKSIYAYQTAYTGEQVVIGNSLFFCGSDPSVYQELWRIGLPLKITTQPQSRIVALGSAVTFTVASNSTSSISYSWKKNGVEISNEVSSTFSIASAGLADAADYTAQLESDDGTAGSTVAQLAVVNTNVAAVSIAAGGTITLNVTATAPPGAALTYLWRRGGTLLANGPIASAGLISGATTGKLTITKATAAEAGNYTCTVGMGSLNLTTQPASVSVVSAPVVLTHPESRLISVASSVTFSAAASNAAGVSYQWLRNGADISGATTSSYTIDSAALTHGGEYRCQMTNAAGSSKTDAAKLGVVRAVSGPVGVSENGTLKLSVAVAAPSTSVLSYIWRKDAAAISNGPLVSGASVSGATSESITISSVTAAEAGDYTCTISMSGLSMVVNPATVSIVSKPVITTTSVPSSIVSGQFTWQLAASDLPTAFMISGLPSGLTANLASGLITGVPNVAGQSKVKVSAKNTAGTGAVKEFILNVDPLTDGLAGSYTGLVARHDEIALLGGNIATTVTTTGALTGTLKLGATSYSFKGRVMVPESGDPVAVTSIALSKTSTAKLTLSFQPDDSSIHSENSTFYAELESGVYTAQMQGRRLPWSKANLPTDWAGAYNVLIEASNIDDLPRGRGYMQMVVNATSGAVSVTGRAGDGTAFTGSYTLWNNGKLPLYCLLYGKKGHLMGLPQIEATIPTEDNWVHGSLDWLKTGPASATDKLYNSGFDVVGLTLDGSKWVKPAAGSMLLDLPNQADNARVEFSHAGIEDVAQAASVSQTFQITSKHTAKFATATTGNPCLVTMTLNATTGLFTGSFKLSDLKPGSTTVKVPRTVAFGGILVSHLEEGFGSFSLPGLDKTAPTEVGLVHLKQP